MLIFKVYINLASILLTKALSTKGKININFKLTKKKQQRFYKNIIKH